MRTLITASVAPILFLTIGSAPAWAAPSLLRILHPERPRGAPGPIAAAGLPFLLAAGAIAAYRRRRQR